MAEYLPPNARPCEQCGDRKGERIAGYRQRWLCGECYKNRLKIPFRDYPRATLILTIASLFVGVGSCWIGQQQLNLMRPPSPENSIPELDPFAPRTLAPREETAPRMAEPDLGAPPGQPHKPRRLREDDAAPDIPSASTLQPEASVTPPVRPDLIVAAPVLDPVLDSMPPKQDSEWPAPSTTTGHPLMGEIQILPTSSPEPTVTVEAFSRHARPLQELSLPNAPPAMRPSLSGRCIVVHVSIDSQGRASPIVISKGGIHPFVVERAKRDAGRRWLPALGAEREPVSDRVEVRYCWK